MAASAKARRTSWRWAQGLMAFLLLAGNPWVMDRYFGFLLAHIWEGNAVYHLAVAVGFLWGAYLLVAALGMGAVTDVAMEGRPWQGLTVWLVFLALFPFFGAMAVRGLEMSEASSAVANVRHAERLNQGPVPVRQALQAMTETPEDLAQWRDEIRALANAQTSPDRLLIVLAAAEALPADHPAVAFVLANNLVRRQDTEAIQLALLAQMRQGNRRAGEALALLGTPRSGGGAP